MDDIKPKEETFDPYYYKDGEANTGSLLPYVHSITNQVIKIVIDVK